MLRDADRQPLPADAPWPMTLVIEILFHGLLRHRIGLTGLLISARARRHAMPVRQLPLNGPRTTGHNSSPH